MRITSKLQITFLIIGGLIGAIAITAIVSFNRLKNKIGTIYDDRIVPLTEIKAITDNYGFLIIDAVNKTENRLLTPKEALQNVQTAKVNNANLWAEYRQTYLIPEEVKLVQELEALFIPAEQKINELIDILENDSPDQLEQIATFDREIYLVIDPIVEKLKRLEEIQLEIAAQERKNSEMIVTQMWFVFIPILMATLVFVIIGRSLINRAILSTIKKTISVVEQNGVQVNSASTEISASGRQLESSTTEQITSINEVTASAKEIEYISLNLASSIQQVAHAVQSTNTAANNSQADLILMEQTMTRLTDSTESIARKLGLINDKANNINNAVITITKVADQTNLLSLNAAIEAEKAGEYGAGFSVVAREIRRLADQTAIATLDIEAMVKEMQSSVANGVMEMDQFSQSVKLTVKDIHKISGRIIQIIEQIQEITPQFEIVSQSMSNQSEGTQQIREAMEQLSLVSQQNSTSLSETNNALAQLNIASQVLREEITNLQAKI